MKSCPNCNRTYTDASLNFCLEDGTPLITAPAPGIDPNATIRYDPRDTKAPPDPIQRQAPPSYQAPPPIPSRGSNFGQQQHAPMRSAGVPAGKSNMIWWVLGGA